MSDKYTFKILRFDPQTGDAPYWQSYEVPNLKDGMNVLDGLIYIQQYLDGSLGFRTSCRAGVCGSCAMHIAGTYRLACETQIKFLGTNTITVRPLSHVPIIKDLVVDMTPFYQKYESIQPYLMSGTNDVTDGQERLQSRSDREKLDNIIDCILCGACYASCPMTAADPKYLGPAALMKANRFVVDSRDDNIGERLNIVGDEHGIFRCHTAFNCTEVCPKHLDPAGSIANLKRKHLTVKITKVRPQ